MSAPTIDFAGLTSSQGFIIQGDVAGDQAGYSVSSAGDINGDGFADLIVGAPFGANGGSNAGEAYVIFGKAGTTRPAIDLTNLAATDGFIVQGNAAGDYAGLNVASAGDINGDGLADMIIGAPYGGAGAGETYVIFGKAGATRANIDLTSLDASDGFIIQGDVAGDSAGWSVSSAGDTNGDGFADLIVGAPYGGAYAGKAYVVFGKAGATRATIDLTSLAASDGFSIQGDATGDQAGFSVSSAGDINGDGFADVIVGAPTGDNGGTHAGEAYVIFGKAGATRTNIDLTTLTAGEGFIIQGDAAGDQAGRTVSSAGDINGDGIADLIVGASGGDDGGSDAGEAYVIFGKAAATRANIDLSALSASDGFVIQGNVAGDQAGFSVSSAGDINGDGIADLIVGAPLGDNGAVDAGDAYVIIGKAGATRANISLTTLAAGDGFIIQGDGAGDQAGRSVAAAGDTNGDGFADLIIGAPRGDDGGSDAGEAYVIYGRAGLGLAPVVADDSFTAVQDQIATYATFQLLGNDASAFPLTISEVSNATGGTVVLNADQTISFTPTGGFTGTAGFDYTASDGTQSDSGHVTITVAAPVAAKTIDLSGLTSSQGFIIQGDVADDRAGFSVSSAGDINGDGFADLIIGAPRGDNGGSNAGEAYVIFGNAGTTRANIDLTSLAASDGFIIHGNAGDDQAGSSVSSAGDINGDGFVDLIVGARFGDNGGSNAGEAYVIFGKAGATRANIDLTSLTASNGFIIQGDEGGDRAGYSVSSAGDVNGDGFADLIVGADAGDNGGTNAGEAYVIFGKTGATRVDIDLTSLAAIDGFIIQGDVAGDYAGRSVSSAGDINGDGFADIVVGAPYGDNGGNYAGEAYVIFGKAGATRVDIDLTSLSASDGFIIQGDLASDLAGWSVASAGDINGDGIIDLTVGALGGEAYVVFGKTGATRADIDLTSLSASDGFKIQANASNDQAGRSVSSAGDINGDGFADLIVGAPRGDNGGNNAGEAYVIFGRAGAARANIDLNSLTASDGFIIQGDAPSDRAGQSVASAGDINGDGFADLIVGALYGDNGGSSAGEAYVIYGRADFGSAPVAGDDSLTAVQDQTATLAAFQLLGNDVSAFTLTVSAVSNATGGTVVLNADKTITFTPTAGFTGTAGFDYTASDGVQGDTGHVTITVSAPLAAKTIDLTGLTSSQGFIIQGDLPGDQAGTVSSAGDINGDGFADFIVGVRYGDNGGINAGEAYVIFGKAGAARANIDLTSLAGGDGFIIQGDVAGDQAGFSVAAAGDINSDGFADLIVGAGRGDNGGADAGEAYVIFGKAGATRANIDLTSLAASDGFIVQGDVAGDYAGQSIASAGDINGDGFADMIVGALAGDNGGAAAGEAYVIFGKAGATRTNIDLTSLAAADGFIIQGDVAGDLAGSSVSSAGDINGDGFADLIVGAPRGDNGGADSGEAYVIFGKAGATRTNIDLTSLAAADGFIIQGDVAGDYAGQSVSSAGDINGDGFADLIVGVRRGDNGGADSGEAYVIFGKAGATRTNIDLTSLAAADGFIIQGDVAGDEAGNSVSSAGDINGDGFADLIVGAHRGDNGGTYSGEAYVIFGKAGATRANIDLTSLAASDGFVIQGDVAGDFAGRSVSSAGDINRDGFADLILGAPLGDNGGSAAGEAYVIYGRADFGSAPVAGDDALTAVQDQTATYAAFQLLGNDASAFTLTVSAVSNATGGTVVLNADKTISFTPTAGFTGIAGFDYTVSDGVQGDTGHVTITVAAPVAAKTIDLTGLTSSQGFIIQGDEAGDEAGLSVSSAGDINGDGFADLIVGAPYGDNGYTGAGEAYVIFGKAGAARANIDLTSLTASEGFIIQGDAAGDYAGRSVSSAGDVNGDGFADLIVGAPSGSNGGVGAGEAYVIFGKAGATRANIDLTSLAAADGFIIQGDVAFDRTGSSVSSAGDINGDGFADLIVGATRGDNGGTDAGEAYVIFGKAGATRANIDLTSLAAADGFIIQGDVAYDFAGRSVSSAGDINGDGFADMIVGASGGDNGGIYAGEAYVIFGKAGVTRANIDLTSLAAADGFVIQGDVAGDEAGFSVSSAGDINGDGFADLIVGASSGDDGGTNAGESYVIFGKAGATRANIDLTSPSTSDGFIIQGDVAGDSAGFSVSTAGDIDGDGFADLIVGALNGGNGGSNAGEAYVIFGKAGATRADVDLTSLSTSDGFIIQGDVAGDQAGRSVSSAGDINGDGFADLIVGAPLGDDGGTNAGEAYVIYGSADIGRTNDAPTAAPVTLAAIDEDSGARIITAAELLVGATDVDSPALAITLLTLISGNGTLVANGDDTWTYTPAANDDTAAEFAYTVSDGSLTASSTATLDITPINDQPTVTSIESQTANVGVAFSFNPSASFSDPDTGDTLMYSLDYTGGGVPGWLSIIAGTGELIGTPGTGDVGETSFLVMAMDHLGQFVVQYVQLTVEILNTPQSYVGTAGDDIFVASTNDTWTVDGMEGNDDITTLDGNDTFIAGKGNDIFRSGGGDDLFTFSGSATANGFDLINGESGTDEVRALANNTVIGLTWIDNVELITANGKTGVSVRGSADDDFFDFSGSTLVGITSIKAGAGADYVVGSNGNDTIEGEAGNDTIFGGDGNDVFVVKAGAGFDSYIGGNGIDTIRVASANTKISGLDMAGIEFIDTDGFANVSIVGDDAANNIDLGGITVVGTVVAINAGAGADIILGTSGDDTVDGGTGNDQLVGGDGNDVFLIKGGAGFDTFDGGNGIDIVRAASANVKISGLNMYDVEFIDADGFANVSIIGDSADNFINLFGIIIFGTVAIDGGSGNDTIFGSDSNDVIKAGVGKDILTGHLGDDVFDFDATFHSGAGTAKADTIADFMQGFDTIDLSTIDASSVDVGNNDFTFIGDAAFGGIAGELRYDTAVSPGMTVVYGDTNGDGRADMEIRLTGTITLTDLDFML
ncbi:MAG: cadherin-like domain-containing protein [Novosphingobium sp.]|uniref:cadherin-like domain-containing protein n=1 Tax=Novosphingobium sp. TaxID=1874826 RepID=UPI002735F59D|nr:cadherin-like domain-containing protein [Novosphingobium sp.]MDP3549336.1 cadherin-like domain-containing protein [Novosphingobium sp.]